MGGRRQEQDRELIALEGGGRYRERELELICGSFLLVVFFGF